MAKIICVVGARPNFPKVAPLWRALKTSPALKPVLVHTGQHYDASLSAVFFADLDLPAPNHDLRVGPGPSAERIATMIQRFAAVLAAEQPQAVIVVGDVDSTLACALATSKFRLQTPYASRWGQRCRPALIHVEAGLRSFDDDMPEEVNRRLTDSLADVLFVTEPAAAENLRREGIAEERITLVGNVIIDSLFAWRDKAHSSDLLHRLGLGERAYAVLTLHRPSNVDHPKKLQALLSALDQIAEKQPIVFPVHPRTRQKLADDETTRNHRRWRICPPLGYVDFVRLLLSARLVCTDSGGVQEETTALGIPCLTLREQTERPITLTQGTNRLAGTTGDSILAAYREIQRCPPRGMLPALWDGQTAQRIAAILEQAFAVR